MTQDDNSAALAHQQQIEHQQYLLNEEAYTKWLYDNYFIGNGDMLVRLLEDADVALTYLAEHGLPLDSVIVGL
jgi:hypothetical protein